MNTLMNSGETDPFVQCERAEPGMLECRLRPLIATHCPHRLQKIIAVFFILADANLTCQFARRLHCGRIGFARRHFAARQKLRHHFDAAADNNQMFQHHCRRPEARAVFDSGQARHQNALVAQRLRNQRDLAQKQLRLFFEELDGHIVSGDFAEHRKNDKALQERLEMRQTGPWSF